MEYRLTAKGEALVPLVDQMRSYGQQWLEASEAAQPAPAGEEIEPAYHAA